MNKPAPPAMRTVVYGDLFDDWRPWAFAVGVEILIVVAALALRSLE